MKKGDLTEDDDVESSALLLNLNEEKDNAAAPPTIDGESPGTLQAIKMFVLVSLLLQNAGQALITRYSQGILKEKYSSTEVVFVAEMIKLLVSGYLAVQTKEEHGSPLGSGVNKLTWLLVNSRGVIIVVILYGFQNLLAFYALSKVEASLYSVLTQLKTLTTAGFSVVFLGRFVTMTKWRALILLVIGCVLVASPNFNQCLDSSASASKAATTDEDYIGTLLGVSSLLVIVTISGFSSVYLEGILKQTDIKVGIWHRNFQMAAWSAVFLVLADLYVRANSNHSYDAFLHDWSFNTVVIVILQAGGGLLVAATLKYADSILKTLAISGSIVLSAVLGYFLLGGQLDAFVSMGCLCTILAIFNYSFDTSA